METTTPSADGSLTFFGGIGPAKESKIRQEYGDISPVDFAIKYLTTDGEKIADMIGDRFMDAFHESILRAGVLNTDLGIDENLPGVEAMLFARIFGVVGFCTVSGSSKIKSGGGNLRVTPDEIDWMIGGIIDPANVMVLVWDIEKLVENVDIRGLFDRLCYPANECRPRGDGSNVQFFSEESRVILSEPILKDLAGLGFDPFSHPEEVHMADHDDAVVRFEVGEFPLVLAPRVPGKEDWRE